ncbi:hypothetical protein F5888DRAFT_1638822 [Russula emetica]|nr:hypothetical protein F5888DRAFT_1638822 [Russula emetica]
MTSPFRTPTPRDIHRQPTDPEDARWLVHLGTACLGSWRIALDVPAGSSGFPMFRGSCFKRHKGQTVREILRTFDGIFEPPLRPAVRVLLKRNVLSSTHAKPLLRVMVVIEKAPVAGGTAEFWMPSAGGGTGMTPGNHAPTPEHTSDTTPQWAQRGLVWSQGIIRELAKIILESIKSDRGGPVDVRHFVSIPGTMDQNDESPSFWEMTADPDQSERPLEQADQRHHAHHIATSMIRSDIGRGLLSMSTIIVVLDQHTRPDIGWDFLCR